MRIQAALALMMGSVLFPGIAYSQDGCDSLTLSDQEIKEIVDQGRATRTDLPDPFEDYRWEVRRRGCQYIYLEYGLPETPEHSRIFRLNRHGTIVDVQPSDKRLQCADEVLTEAELAQIVSRSRELRQDVPRPYASYRTRIDRMGCLYLYFEYAIPEVKGKYQVFTIDPYGELLEYSESQPY